MATIALLTAAHAQAHRHLVGYIDSHATFNWADLRTCLGR